jgi:ribose transport system ATP-binding protein
VVGAVIRELDVRPPNAGAAFGALSGGNQQKVVIGKWLLLRPSLLVLDDPTYGVDPGARRSILALVREAAAEGVGVLLFSTEPEQLVATCARVVVVREGRNTHEIAGDRLDLQTLTELAWG